MSIGRNAIGNREPPANCRSLEQQAEIQFLETQIRALKAMKAQVMQRAQNKDARNPKQGIWSWRPQALTWHGRPSQIKEAGITELNMLLSSLDKRLQELLPRPKAKNEVVARAVSWLRKNEALSSQKQGELFQSLAECLSCRNPRMDRLLYEYLMKPPDTLSRWENGQLPFDYSESKRFVDSYREAKKAQPDNPLAHYCREGARESLAALAEELEQTEKWRDKLLHGSQSFEETFQEISNDLSARIRGTDEDLAIARKRLDTFLGDFADLDRSSKVEIVDRVLEVKLGVLKRLFKDAQPVLERTFPRYLMLAQQNQLSNEVFKLRHRQPGFVVYYQAGTGARLVKLFKRTAWKNLLNAWTGTEQKGLGQEAVEALVGYEPWDVDAQYEVALGGKQNNDIYITKTVRTPGQV